MTRPAGAREAADPIARLLVAVDEWKEGIRVKMDGRKTGACGLRSLLSREERATIRNHSIENLKFSSCPKTHTHEAKELSESMYLVMSGKEADSD